MNSIAWRRALAADAMFVWLALGAGAVDAISFFGLGRVFTANMTGNIVLLGLAVGQAAGAEVARSATALVVFSIGLFGAARLARRTDASTWWTRRMTVALAVEALVQAAFLAGWLASSAHPGAGLRLALVATSALAMGIQSGAVLALRIRGISTTFVTGTMAGVLRDLASGEGWSPDRVRRALVVVSILVGAALAAVLLVHARRFAPLLPLAITVAVVFRAVYGLHSE
jgi:uncharacterized membrane protein YoaK (UPF0700 family)